MKWRALFKFDVFRFALIIGDALIVFFTMGLGYYLVFDGVIPASFQLQRPYFLSMALSVVLALFSFLGVYSRRLPQYGERDARLIVLGALSAEVFVFVSQSVLSPEYWPYVILFWILVFVARAGVGIYASYRSFFFPTWQLLVVPAMAALAGVVTVRLQNPMFPIPDAALPISKTIHALYFFSSVSLLLVFRWTLHWLFLKYKRPHGAQLRAILVGSDAEVSLFSRINSLSGGFKIVAILDNDPLKWGMRMLDARVMGGTNLLGAVAKEYNAQTVLLLKDSLSLEEFREIESICQERSIRLVRLGSLQESLLRGDSLSTADLLERKEYRLPSANDNYLKGKRVMVTGAGGSIGSELVRQILRCDPSQVILLGRGENSIFELERELQNSGYLNRTKSIIVNVADADGLERTFRATAPQIVFHAAAHKHVPLMEFNIHEAVRNNVLGTWNVMKWCGEIGVERVVMISTDKAVAPASVMGATKRKAELAVAEAAQKYLRTKYSVVRFGNVLGSRGSVVRLFLDQIRRGGPVTVTDPRMTRFFMTIPEAVSLVLASATLYKGFGIFVLEMGKPYRIAELAEKMIRMCGLEPGRDIQIEYTGVRPGEKLEEILVTGQEVLEPTSNASIQKLVQLPIKTESSLVVEQVNALLTGEEQSLRVWLLP